MDELEIDGPIKFAQVRSTTLPVKEVLNKHGIYLWTIKTGDGYLIYYIGETGVSFNNRLNSHLESLITGKYRIYDPIVFSQGKKILLWNPYFIGARRRESYLSEFEKVRSNIASKIQAYIELFDLFVIPFSGDTRMRRRIEASIEKVLKESGMTGVQSFLDEGIVFQSILLGEEPISFGIKSKYTIIGFPNVIVV